MAEKNKTLKYFQTAEVEAFLGSNVPNALTFLVLFCHFVCSVKLNDCVFEHSYLLLSCVGEAVKFCDTVFQCVLENLTLIGQ